MQFLFHFIVLQCSMDPSWTPPAPCRVGDRLRDVDTPALVLDLDKMDANRTSLRNIMAQYPSVAVRPHAKAHKCPPIARLQVQDGAVGVCAQTLTEAEAIVYGGGCTDVFVSNQVRSSVLSSLTKLWNIVLSHLSGTRVLSAYGL